MKIAIKILRIIFAIILTVSIIGITVVKVVSSKILNEAYVYNRFQTGSYNETIFNDIQSNFEKYIAQSGFDKEVLNDIYTMEDIKEDTEKILDNIYEGTNNTIESKNIREKLLNNINKSLEDEKQEITPAMQQSIDKFVDTICDEYVDTISHTEYESAIHTYLKKANQLVEKGQKALFVAIIVSIVAIIALSIKELYSGLIAFGISALSSGSFLAIAISIIKSNITIEHVRILNDAVSQVLQGLILNMISQFSKTGIILTIVGIIIIIFGNIIRTKDQRS